MIQLSINVPNNSHRMEPRSSIPSVMPNTRWLSQWNPNQVNSFKWNSSIPNHFTDAYPQFDRYSQVLRYVRPVLLHRWNGVVGHHHQTGDVLCYVPVTHQARLSVPPVTFQSDRKLKTFLIGLSRCVWFLYCPVIKSKSWRQLSCDKEILCHEWAVLFCYWINFSIFFWSLLY